MYPDSIRGDAVGVMLSTDLTDPQAVPYFLWDDPMTVTEFKAALQSASLPERARLLGKLLREARDNDVWKFVSPEAVWSDWTAIAPHLGRRRGFWEFLLAVWQQEGLIGR